MRDDENVESKEMPGTKRGIFKNLNSEKNGTTAEEVVTRLREMIQNGELAAGDRLPPERDLAKLLGVSRPTLRAGIRSLATVGILQSKQGAGTFVAEAEESPTLDTGALKLLSALHGFTSDEMFEARIALEMSIAALAAERATSEQMAQLAEEIAGMYASVERPEQYLVHDMQFHQTVAAASGNRILTALMNMVAWNQIEYRRQNRKRPTGGQE
jgi:GntR family transcriptional repressor for pyruvate dehydrogenase complex